jgi:OOP family OmpA-OmpF porin
MTRINSLAINVLAAAAAIACMTSASAQSNESYNPNAYVLLNGSAMKPDSKFPEDKTGYGGGARIGVPLSPSWDLQFGGTFAQSKNNGSKVREWLAGVDALYLFTPGGFRPFVLVGAGGARDSVSEAGVGSWRHTAPYVNAGVGFQYKITPTLGMQADIRETDSFYRHRDTIDGMKHAANTYANVGLTWAFGGPPAPPVMPVTITTRTEETTVATTPAPAPVMAPPPPPPAPVMKKYTLSASELFGFNSAKLGANQPKLDEVAATMNANADIASVTIVGYTDRIGSNAYNQKLSEQRANSVKAYLQGKGVAESRLTAVGKGEADPVVECKDEKKRPALIKCLEPNRRVEIEPVTFTKQVN